MFCDSTCDEVGDICMVVGSGMFCDSTCDEVGGICMVVGSVMASADVAGEEIMVFLLQQSLFPQPSNR